MDKGIFHRKRKADNMVKLQDILKKKRNQILKDWFELAVNQYPTDAKKFLVSVENRFANPIRASLLDGMNGLYDRLVAGETFETQDSCAFLDAVIRVRAVQDLTAAQAIGFIFFLKDAVRAALAGEIGRAGMLEELLTFESKIDNVALLAFNMFMQCREKIYELKATELRNRTSRILERACRIWDAQERAPEER